VENWLFQRLVEIEYGDPALAALLTGNVPPIAKTVVQYSALSTTKTAGHVCKALQPFDTVEPSVTGQNGQHIGSRYAPSAAEVYRLLERIAEPLTRSSASRRGQVVAIHNAITLYTVLFYLIATCARPADALLPDQDAIDPLTGFLILNDKPTRDNFKTRLVWVSEPCREQLRLFRSHLAKVRNLHPSLAGPGDRNRPYILTENGRPYPLDRARLRESMQAYSWPYPANFSRHFVRSQLLGEVTSEALHALFGHWHLGTEPWGQTAALDPLAYRAELKRALLPLCGLCGLKPRPGL
jgi:integrase